MVLAHHMSSGGEKQSLLLILFAICSQVTVYELVMALTYLSYLLNLLVSWTDLQQSSSSQLCFCFVLDIKVKEQSIENLLRWDMDILDNSGYTYCIDVFCNSVMTVHLFDTSCFEMSRGLICRHCGRRIFVGSEGGRIVKHLFFTSVAEKCMNHQDTWLLSRHQGSCWRS